MDKQKHSLKKSALAVALAAASTMGHAAQVGETNFDLTGYIKFDALLSSYSDGTPPGSSLTRDFYIPSLTPVTGDKEGKQLDFHPKQSRLRLTSLTPDSDGDTLKGVIEIDFLVTDGGNERISNSWVPRIRHAYIEYKGWLLGQQWSTFMDTAILPETLDFVGVPDGIGFNRQPMIRYSTGGWQFALENPESTITPFGGGGRIVSDDNKLPDAVITYTHRQDWGYIKVATLMRQLEYDNGLDFNDTENSFGVNISSKVVFANGDDLRLSVVAGSGMGRYFGLNVANGGVINANNELEAIDSAGFSIAYRHKWDEKWRSSWSFSRSEIDNDTSLTGTGATRSTFSTRVNLLYSPTKKLTIGGEYAFARRETENEQEGDMNRLQFSAKYAF